jgi:uncharacterized protein (DUF2252 family)
MAEAPRRTGRAARTSGNGATQTNGTQHDEGDGDGWTARPWVGPSERAERGRAARSRVPRSSHAAFAAAPERDPIAILEAQEADRVSNLLPLRHARMADSAFAYYRGTPAVMAMDLSTTPVSGLHVQASGDAHLGNFGLFASPERALVFDANDFDETLRGPWEWDVKRLAASMVIASRANGFPAAEARRIVLETVRAYRLWMGRYAAARQMDVEYARITESDIRELSEASGLLGGRDAKARRDRFESVFTQARRRDGMRAFEKLTTIVDGKRVIVDDPPVISHVDLGGGRPVLERVFTTYRESLNENRRSFLERYRLVDWALKVVGVGSVGTRCFVVVLEGRDSADPLILQVKEAVPSVLEAATGADSHPHHGQRVVIGQRAMQATPDILLGWTSGPGGRHFYVRQLWDMKGSVDTTALLPIGMGFYGRLCGWSLARAHARTGDAIAIAAYLGTSDKFDGAIADFSEAYADVNARDHAAYVAAVDAGRIEVPAR